MSDSISTPAVLTTTITASKGWVPINAKALWNYRELLLFLVWRDLKVRYRQTVLGVAWAIIQPFFTMVVFSVFFGKLAGIPSDGVPYPVFVFTALVPWTLFAYALSTSTESIVANKNLVTKVFFPRLLIPFSTVVAGLVDFLLAFVILVAMLFYFQIYPTWRIVTLPPFVILATLTALSAGLWLSALNVQFRDVRYTIPFLTQFWMFLTPIAYPSSIVPESWKVIYSLNPMTGVVNGFRWALLGKSEPPGTALIVSVAVVALAMISGLYYFRRMERTFADIV